MNDVPRDPQQSDNEQKLTRRIFVQYSAAIAASSSMVCAVALKTDALAQVQGKLSVALPGDDNGMPYHYVN
ncbi:MAG: hypothetical protein ACO1RT_16840 [Planctomycetaceae bacterium]